MQVTLSLQGGVGDTFELRGYPKAGRTNLRGKPRWGP